MNRNHFPKVTKLKAVRTSNFLIAGSLQIYSFLHGHGLTTLSWKVSTGNFHIANSTSGGSSHDGGSWISSSQFFLGTSWIVSVFRNTWIGIVSCDHIPLLSYISQYCPKIISYIPFIGCIPTSHRLHEYPIYRPFINPYESILNPYKPIVNPW